MRGAGGLRPCQPGRASRCPGLPRKGGPSSQQGTHTHPMDSCLHVLYRVGAECILQLASCVPVHLHAGSERMDFTDDFGEHGCSPLIPGSLLACICQGVIHDQAAPSVSVLGSIISGAYALTPIQGCAQGNDAWPMDWRVGETKCGGPIHVSCDSHSRCGFVMLKKYKRAGKYNSCGTTMIDGPINRRKARGSLDARRTAYCLGPASTGTATYGFNCTSLV